MCNDLADVPHSSSNNNNNNRWSMDGWREKPGRDKLIYWGSVCVRCLTVQVRMCVHVVKSKRLPVCLLIHTLRPLPKSLLWLQEDTNTHQYKLKERRDTIPNYVVYCVQFHILVWLSFNSLIHWEALCYRADRPSIGYLTCEWSASSYLGLISVTDEAKG